MARKEDQFYEMIKEAFQDFTPEAPSHIFESVKANMGRKRGFASNRFIWAGAIVLFLGGGLVWFYLNNSKSQMASIPDSISTTINGAVYKAQRSLVAEDVYNFSEDEIYTIPEQVISNEPETRTRKIRPSFSSTPENRDKQELLLPSDGDVSNQTNSTEKVLPSGNMPEAEVIPHQDAQISPDNSVTTDPGAEPSNSEVPESRKFVIKGKKTITIDE
jgi:hypothetical protein